MPWWQKSVFSSSTKSSTSTSPPRPPSKRTSNNFRELNNLFRSLRRSQPRLTRQRKLRHLSDLEVGGRYPPYSSFYYIHDENSPFPSPASTIAVDPLPPPPPLPLPLPEVGFLHQNSSSAASQSGHFPLPSPSPSPKDEDDEDEKHRNKDKERDDIARDSETANDTAIPRRFTHQTIHKKTEHVDTVFTNSSIDRGKRTHQDSNGVENLRNTFRLNATAMGAPGSGASAMSAPGSGFSSPVLSPRRISAGDFSSSPYMASQGLQTWSAPEIPTMEMMRTGLSRQPSPEIPLTSPERSALHSPGLNHKPSGTASPSTAWHDSNGHVTVHPLPLPPRASVSSQTAIVNQTAAKPEVSPMTSQWQKGKLIGRGTFGSVYVATNRETGALCAMKEVDLIPDDPKSAECIKQLEQEIKVLSQLKHRNIVQYYGSEIVEDRFYIYLEYVHPGSINKYVREHCGAMTESVVRSFTRHILHGLAYLHSTKTIHRDIKGANLLVDAFGVVKLADFGMAKHLNGQAADLSMKGSPYWMAPEIIHSVTQSDSSGDFAFAVDIWSLGCTIIEMLNGKPPWSEFEGAAAMFKVWKESPPIPETLSPAGKDFLQCCFQRNPAERPSASKLLEHHFIRNSYQVDVPAFTQEFSGMKLVDPSGIPREWTRNAIDSMPISPISQTTKGKLSSRGETGQQSHHETSDSTAGCHHSPRSTLEALPSLSPPHSERTHTSKPSPNGVNGINMNSGSSSLYARRRTQ